MSHSNKNKGPRAYPNIGDILARKARGRHEIALMSFGRKIRMLDVMQAQVGTIRKAREAWPCCFVSARFDTYRF